MTMIGAYEVSKVKAARQLDDEVEQEGLLRPQEEGQHKCQKEYRSATNHISPKPQEHTFEAAIQAKHLGMNQLEGRLLHHYSCVTTQQPHAQDRRQPQRFTKRQTARVVSLQPQACP